MPVSVGDLGTVRRRTFGWLMPTGVERERPRTLSRQIERTLSQCEGLVRGVARRHGLADADVDEVFQDVRVRLWRVLRQEGTIRSINRSYVYKTASSAALDILRRRRAVREEPLHPGAEAIPSARFHAQPERTIEGRRLMQTVQQAVDSLIESRRPVVRMYLAGYKLPEIAETLGWTSSKTRNLLYRGLHDLRVTLVDLGVGPDHLD